MWPGWIRVSRIDFSINIWVHLSWDKRSTSSPDRRPKSWIVLSFLIVCILDHDSTQIREELLILGCVEHHVLRHFLFLGSWRYRRRFTLSWTELRYEIIFVSRCYVAMVWSKALLTTTNDCAAMIVFMLVSLVVLITSTYWLILFWLIL